MWRFVQLSDVHLGSSVDGQWEQWVPLHHDARRDRLFAPRPSPSSSRILLLVTGDIASHQNA